MPDARTSGLVATLISLQGKVAVFRSVLGDPRASNADRKDAAIRLESTVEQLNAVKGLLGIVDEDMSEGRLVQLATSAMNDIRAEVREEIRREVVQVKAEESSLAGVDYERLGLDFEYFCAVVLEVTYRPGMQPANKGAAGPFILTSAQRLVVAVFVEILLVQQKPLRAIILKSRQLGCTTLLLAFAIWLLFTRPHYHVMLIIDKNEHGRTKRETVIKWVEAAAAFECFPGIAKRDEKILFLSNGGRLFFESAEASNPGTSEMLHMLIESEKPKWPYGRAREVKESVLPGLPSAPLTVHIDESTAVGLDDFYFRWRRAERGQEEIGGVSVVPIFLPWYLSPEYSVSAPPNFRYLDEDEEVADVGLEAGTNHEVKLTESQYAAKYQLSPSQVLWRRQKIKLTFDGNRASFNKEYPTTAEHAWAGAGGGYFSKTLVKRVKDYAMRGPPTRRGSLVDVQGYTDVARPLLYHLVRPIFKDDSIGEYVEWEEPKTGQRYYVGVDVAEGKTTEREDGEMVSDQTVFYVMDQQGYLVALWVARWRPDEAWLPLLFCGRWWNDALINGERNSPGLTLMSFFIQTGYPAMLVRQQPEHAPVIDRTWTTVSPLNRDGLLAEFRAAVAADYRRVRSTELAEEMENFTVVMRGRRPRAEARGGCHDDILFAGAHAEHARRKLGGTLDQWERPVVDATGPSSDLARGPTLLDTDLLLQMEGDPW